MKARSGEYLGRALKLQYFGSAILCICRSPGSNGWPVTFDMTRRKPG